jgi:hypothetical protein
LNHYNENVRADLEVRPPQGGIATQHLDAYLDEFSLRFNRRASKNRGLLFYRLVIQCLETNPLTYETIVLSRRGQRGKLRGRAAGAPSTAAPGSLPDDDIPFLAATRMRPASPWRS